MFLARIQHENGMRDEKDFAVYEDMITWLATLPEVGVMCWEDDAPVDQTQIQTDVEALL